MTSSRAMWFATLIVGWLLLGAAPALADPPGPTNYASEIVKVVPDPGGFAIDIVGGDSFVSLRDDPGTEVEVIGYSGEPYLRFNRDGTVEENARAPSKYLNEDRFAAAELPAGADATAAPDWVVVSRDGSFAWHDHRTHWMNTLAPPGLGPGDTVAEGVVPLRVDGVAVAVTVRSVWQPSPAVAPVAAGLLLGALLGAAALLPGRSSARVTLILALLALFVGVAAYRSVPSETGPPWSLVVFPTVGVLLAAPATFPRLLGRGAALVRRYRAPLLLLASLELLAWGVLHWGWLWLSILPTDLPFWLDRSIAASVLAGSLGTAAAASRSLASVTASR